MAEYLGVASKLLVVRGVTVTGRCRTNFGSFGDGVIEIEDGVPGKVTGVISVFAIPDAPAVDEAIEAIIVGAF